MRTDLRFRLLPLLAGALLLAVGCQTYDFQPVPPVTIGQDTITATITANPLKANLLLVLDRSGSMNLPFDATPPSCGTCGQSGQPACDPTTCPSRWATLTDVATDYLTANAKLTRLGVAFYPQLSDATIQDASSGNLSNFCTATSSIDVPIVDSDDDDQLQASADAVKFAIQRVGATVSPLGGGVGGGTPTGASLKFVGDHAGFGSAIQRQSYLLLMTDGLPNCNPTNGLDANQNPAACACTDGPTSSTCTYYPNLDCNDFNETASKVSDIRAEGIKTIVIGYGDAAGASAQTSLQQIALAGDFQRHCAPGGAECDPADTACFQDTSPTTLCAEQFFRATSREQLAAALKAVANQVGGDNPCLVKLTPAPTDPTFLSVVVTENGVTTSYPYPSDVWTFATVPPSNATLTFNDPLCSKMKARSEEITYVVRSVHQL